MFPGCLLKRALHSLRAGLSGTKAGCAVGRAERPLLERPFQPRGPGLEARGEARAKARRAGRTLLLGDRRPTLKQRRLKKKKKRSRPLQKGANRSDLWVLGTRPKRFPCPRPGTKGMRRARNCGTLRHRCVFLNATVAHSWPLHLLGSEKIFSSILHPSPSLRVSSGHGIICFSSSKDIPIP